MKTKWFIISSLTALCFAVTNVELRAQDDPEDPVDPLEEEPTEPPEEDPIVEEPTVDTHQLTSGLAAHFDVSEEVVAEMREDGMGFGEIRIALSLAEAIGDEDALSSVLEARADGQGWGVIAQEHGFNLGAVVSGSPGIGQTRDLKSVEDPDLADSPEQPGVETQAVDRPEQRGRPEGVGHADMPERPERPERPVRPERPERPEHVGRPDGVGQPEHAGRPDHGGRPDHAGPPERPEGHPGGGPRR